ncbi:MAG TPA: DNA translocase FtsK [Bacillota bacterium]|nr:DNA translocase FtsK [Bacillota bacterium]
MSKRSKKKSSKLKSTMKYELIGLLLIFLAIFGSGASVISDGAIPATLENIFRLMLGMWYFVIPIGLLLTGLLLLTKRRYPNMLHKKLIGIYILLFALLLFTHIQVFEKLLLEADHPSIFSLTWNHYLDYIRDEGSVIQLGGGLLGAFLSTVIYYLFSASGAKIVAIFLMVISMVVLTNRSVGDLFNQGVEYVSVLFEKIKERRKNKRKIVTNKEDKPLETIEPVIDQVPEREEQLPIAYAHDAITCDQAEEELHIDEQFTDKQESDESYELPSFQLLTDTISQTTKGDTSQIKATVQTLEKTFQSFGVQAKVSQVHVGPAVTKYEILPESGVKVSRIVSLHDDLALSLAAQDIRIEAPIPGKSAVGIEVPNKDVTTVSLREVLEGAPKKSSILSFALGRDISGQAVVGELNKMPHLLIAGATGSGKSVCINGIITSILMKAKPSEVKMMMIDPKKVELNMYNGIPHLLTPVVTDPKKASQALRKVVAEMERRYEIFSETSTRNIEAYNEYVKKLSEEEQEEYSFLPYIVVLVDELADLMMVASKDVEDAITRLAQMARAAGIHLIIATQRPSVDVITGIIKANIPSRIAFSVSSQVDSRTILDTGGAEKLLGRGDMLYIPVGQSKPVRVQGAFLSDEEVERIVNHCKEQQEVHYVEEMAPQTEQEASVEEQDELFDDAVQLVVEMQTASVSMLQRRFRIGYNRAARLIDAMEDSGIVGPHEGSKPRTVLLAEQIDDE